MSEAPRYGIQELADLADVSRRTVRYYVQEGLLPNPLGVGRGRHYGPAHLEQLLEVKAQQSAGRSLDDIRATLSRRGHPAQSRAAAARATVPPERSVWRRLELAPGVELHVAGNVTLPGPVRLLELADWCRTHFSLRGSTEDDHAR